MDWWSNHTYEGKSKKDKWKTCEKDSVNTEKDEL